MNSNEKLEDLMSQLGEFGPYQMKQTFLSGLAWFLAGVHVMGYVFVFPVLEHRCYIPEFDGIKSIKYTENGSRFSQDILKYIPVNNKGKLQSCLKFDKLGNDTNSTKACNDGYVYRSDYFNSSRISDWDMVCEKSWRRALLQSIFMLGTLIGALFSGLLADKFGRKPVFCVSGILQCFCGVSGVFLNDYLQFSFSMFLYGLFGASGSIVPSVALTMEVVGASYRNICGTMLTLYFGLGALVVAAWAYFLPVSAKELQLIYALHSIILFAHYWIMDESICWLWSNGREEEALAIAERAAKFNGKTFENRYSLSTVSPTITSSEVQGEQQENTSVNNASPDSEDQKSPPKSRSLDLFRYPRLRQRTLVMLYCWFACNLTYFGLSFNSVNLFGNPFMMFVINILVEMPAHLISIGLVTKTGNKPMFSGSLVITGVGCVIVGLLPVGLISTSISLLAKVATTAAFNVVNSYTAELFPTNVRNSAIGFCVMSARIGASVVPEINLLSTAAEEIPAITFGTVGILAGLFAFFLLPETMNRKIPQTVEDVENTAKVKDIEKDNSITVDTISSNM